MAKRNDTVNDMLMNDDTTVRFTNINDSGGGAAATTTTTTGTKHIPGDVMNRSSQTNQYLYAKIHMRQTVHEAVQYNVNDGDNIYHIRKVIKDNNKKLQNVDLDQISLFETPQSSTPLAGRIQWTSNGLWGTEISPLIVRVIGDIPVVVAPTTNNTNETMFDNNIAIEKGKLYIDSIMRSYEDIPDGLPLGNPNDEALGVEVGSELGVLDGVSDGDIVGSKLGALDGLDDGDDVGDGLVDKNLNTRTRTNDENTTMNIGKKMQVLRGVYDLETASTIDVVLRTITEDYWNAVIDATEMYRVCAVGSPGIGKSTTTCILIRLLLERKKTVVYRVRKVAESEYIYVFTPSENVEDIGVTVVEEFIPRQFNDPDIYYVVDPGDTNDSCNLDPDFKGKIIIVASPDEGHWGKNAFTKTRHNFGAGVFLYFPVWSLNELICAKDYFVIDGISFSTEKIEDRFDKVGGIPRHIFVRDDYFQDVLRQQNRAIGKLTIDKFKQLSEDVDAAQTFASDQPGSALMVYSCRPTGNFRDCIVTVASKLVSRELVSKFKKQLWNLLSGRENVKLAWDLFETYCQRLLADKSNTYCMYKFYNEKRRLETATEALSLCLGGCASIKGTNGSLVVAASQMEKTVFYSLNPRHELFDCLFRDGSTYHAFQVTVGRDHSFNQRHFNRFKKEAEKISANITPNRLTEEAVASNALLAESVNDITEEKSNTIDEEIPQVRFVLYYLTYVTKFNDFKLTSETPTRNSEVYIVCVPDPNEEGNIPVPNEEGNIPVPNEEGNIPDPNEGEYPTQMVLQTNASAFSGSTANDPVSVAALRNNEPDLAPSETRRSMRKKRKMSEENQN